MSVTAETIQMALTVRSVVTDTMEIQPWAPPLTASLVPALVAQVVPLFPRQRKWCVRTVQLARPVSVPCSSPLQCSVEVSAFARPASAVLTTWEGERCRNSEGHIQGCVVRHGRAVAATQVLGLQIELSQYCHLSQCENPNWPLA